MENVLNEKMYELIQGRHFNENRGESFAARDIEYCIHDRAFCLVTHVVPPSEN